MTTAGYIAITSMTILIMIGTLLPFINDTFSVNNSEFNNDGVTDGVGSSGVTADGFNPVKLAGSVIGMFFWQWGEVPFYLDMFFTILDLAFFISLFMIIRGT